MALTLQSGDRTLTLAVFLTILSSDSRCVTPFPLDVSAISNPSKVSLVVFRATGHIHHQQVTQSGGLILSILRADCETSQHWQSSFSEPRILTLV